VSTRLREVGERSETDGSSPDLGLVNMKGRLYDPAIGRFISADPFVSNPMSALGWDRYAYVENNPLAFVDPSGFDPYQIYNNDQHYEFEWSPPAAGASGSRQGQGQASGGGHAPSSSGASGGAGSPQATGPSGPTSGPSGAGGPAMGQPAIAHPGNHPIAPQPTAQPTPPGQSNTAEGSGCNQACKDIPNSGTAPTVPTLLNNPTFQIVDTSETLKTELTIGMAIGDAPAAIEGLIEIGISVTGRGLAAGARANMPAWRRIAIDMKEIASGHMPGGIRLAPGNKKDIFHGMTEKQVERAVRNAYRYGTVLKSQGERVFVRGPFGNGTIEMWVNRATKEIETAWPK